MYSQQQQIYPPTTQNGKTLRRKYNRKLICLAKKAGEVGDSNIWLQTGSTIICETLWIFALLNKDKQVTKKTELWKNTN